MLSVSANGEASARQCTSEVADVGSNDELNDAKALAAGDPKIGTREVANVPDGVAQDGLEQRLWAIERALSLEGSGKGKTYEERIWQLQKVLAIKRLRQREALGRAFTNN